MSEIVKTVSYWYNALQQTVVHHSTLQKVGNHGKIQPYPYPQGQFIPVFFNKQIQKGTFEYTLSFLVDNELDLSIFEHRFKNDETGAPAYDPRILPKIILFAYSRGITSNQATYMPSSERS